MPTPPSKKYLRALVDACAQLREHRSPAVPEGLVAPPAPAAAHRVPPAPARAAAILRRDGFCCRYCGAKVVPGAVLRAAALAWPEVLASEDGHHVATGHPLLTSNAAALDVVDPTAPAPDDDGIVTACHGCRAQKGDLSLKRLGWDLRKAKPSAWDGLVSSYETLLLHRRERLLAAADRGFHVRWLRAFDLDPTVLDRWASSPIHAAA